MPSIIIDVVSQQSIKKYNDVYKCLSRNQKKQRRRMLKNVEVENTFNSIKEYRKVYREIEFTFTLLYRLPNPQWGKR